MLTGMCGFTTSEKFAERRSSLEDYDTSKIDSCTMFLRYNTGNIVPVSTCMVS